MNTLGDGNCAFNAFAQALHFLLYNNKIKFENLPQEFVDKALSTTIWNDKNDFKTWLNKDFLTQAQQAELQQKLAPILRAMAIGFLRENYLHTSLDASFESAIIDFKEKGNSDENPDNVFRCIPLFLDQFKNEKSIEALKTWWKKNGRTQYFKHMAQNAESADDVSRWGSQIELEILANIFNITINFTRNDDTILLGAPHGFIDSNDPNRPDKLDFQQLINRNILSRYCGKFSFNNFQNVTLKVLCDPVPHHNILLATLEEFQTRALTIDQWLKNISVDDRLIVRQSLNSHGASSSGYAINDGIAGQIGPPDINKIESCIEPLDNEIQQYLEKHYQQYVPSISISLSTGHWSFIAIKVISKQQSKQSKRIKSEMARSEDYAASGVKRALHGTIYQLMILMLVFKRALAKGNKFKLATEMDAADKFDDMVIGIEDTEGKKIYHYLQAKHKQDKTSTISTSDLANTKDGDFSIIKYFNSYRKIIKEKVFSDGQLGDLILYTNATLELNKASRDQIKLADALIPTNRINTLIELKSDVIGQSYGFNYNQKDKLEVIKIHLKNTSILHQLAATMAQLLFDEKSFDLRIDIFKEYHVALAKQVIDTKNNCFKKTFITGQTHNPALEELLRLFKQYLEKAKKESKTDDKNFKSWWCNFVKNPSISRLSESFGKIVEISKNPQLTSIEDTAVALVNCHKDGAFKVEDKRKKGFRGKQLELLAGHVIVKSTEEIPENSYIFSDNFRNGYKLPGNLEQFRKILIEKLKKAKLSNDLSQYILEIKNYFTCEDGKIDEANKLPKEIPFDVVTDEEVEKFFQKMWFATQQPSETELYKLIADELGDDFNLIDSQFIASHFEHEMLSWFKERHGHFLDRNDAKNMFAKARHLLAKLILLGPKLEYDYHVRQSKIQFNQLFDVRSLLKSSQLFSCIRAHHDTWLTALKIHPALKQLPEYQKDDAFIILRINTAISLVDRLAEAFAQRDLVVIEFSSVPKIKYLRKLFSSLDEIIKTNPEIDVNKKVWFIIPHQFDLNILEEYFIYDVHDDQSNFDDFDEKTQKRLLNKIVNIQGRQIAVGDLFSTDHSRINADMIQMLVSADEFYLSIPHYTMSDFDRECYIPRQFSRCSGLNISVLQKCSDNIIVVSKDKKWLSKTKLLSLSAQLREIQKKEKKTQNQFARVYCSSEHESIQIVKRLKKEIAKYDKRESSGSRFKSRNIHVFLERKENLQWHTSVGSINGIRRFFIPKQFFHHEDDFRANRYSVIAAEPGMGKTTVLSHLLSTHLDEVFPLAMRIDLNQHKQLIDNTYFSSIPDIIEFLAQVFNWNRFSRLYFNHLLLLTGQFDNPRLHFYFDGFDEISSSQQDTIAKLFKLLAKTDVYITVATRRHKTKQLEDTLITPAFRLKEIDRDEQKIYLTHYWNGQFKRLNKERVGLFAEILIEKFSSDLEGKANTFMGIPLQLRLIAEAFEEQVVTFCVSRASEIDEDLQYNPVELYKKIIDKKFRIYFEEKIETTGHIPSNQERLIQNLLQEAHYQLAFAIFFPEANNLTFLQKNDFTDDDLNTVGLIEVRENETQFIHRTFGEYLIAEKITQLLEFTHDDQSTEYLELVEFILFNIFKERCQVIVRFINDIVNLSPEQLLKKRWLDVQGSKICTKEVLPTCGIMMSKENNNVDEEDEKQVFIVDTTEEEEQPDLQQQLVEEYKKIKPYTKPGREYRLVGNAISYFGDFIIKNAEVFPLHVLNKALDTIYTVLISNKNGAIVKTAVFSLMPEFAVVYLRRAFFPVVNKHYDFGKLTRFETISPGTFTVSQYVDQSITTNSYKKFQQELINVRTSEEIINKGEVKKWFEEIDRSKLIAIYIHFKEKGRFLSKNQLNVLIKVYDKFYKDDFYQRVILMISSKDFPLINHLRLQLAIARNENLELLISLREKFPQVSYETKIEKKDRFWNDLNEAKIYYLLHSSSILDVDQFKILMKNYKNFDGNQDYLHLLTKISSSELEIVKQFTIKNDFLDLLVLLKEFFPDFGLVDKEMLTIFNNNRHLYWFERKGVKLIHLFRNFSYGLYDCYQSNLNDPNYTTTERQYHINNIANGLISPWLTNGMFSESSISRKFAFLELVIVFTSDNKASAIIMESKNIGILLDFMTDIIQKYSYDRQVTLEFIQKFKLLSAYMGLNVFIWQQKLIVTDPKSDFNYSMQFDDRAKGIIKLMNADIPLEKDKSHTMKQCEDRLLKLGVEAVKTSVLKQKRRVFLFKPETVKVAFANGTSSEYMQALAENRLHDAAQIHRGKQPRELVYDNKDKKHPYKFFDQLPTKTKQGGIDNLDSKRYQIFKTRY